ncbi:MAG: NUDIX hydrolase [Bacteroidetes bacterium]|nr:MAG: NUDIX hydrolase [Bacteroidota bacterium]RLD78609.1 MAG: NUDIX hydrolase [Bacteroidota bacterium]
MNKADLLKKMLPGFLPLLVFIIVDEWLGTEAGILFALGFGLLELIFIYVREKRIEKFVIVDTVFLVVFGGISLLLDNDIFFKLKPALIELLFCLLIGISAFSGNNIMMKMGKRYMKGVEMNAVMEKQFKRSLKIMFWLFSAHVLMVVYSAYFMSKEAWVFISGGLFYIIFGVYFGVELLRNKLKNKVSSNEEWLPLVDEDGKVIGKAPRSLCHKDKNLLHPVVHVHFFNEKGDIFLQKRPKNKLTQPGKWDTAVGGHISDGETLEEGLEKEVREEIGITKAKYQFIKKYIWESDVERELVYLFFAKTEQKIIINKTELDDGRFWSVAEIKKDLIRELFTPNFKNEFEKEILPTIVHH